MPENKEDNVRAMWSEEELDRALAALGSVADPTEQSLASTRTELLKAAGAPTPAPVKRRWGWWAASAATVIAVVASVLTVQTIRGTNTTAAGQQLTLAADKAGSVDDPLGPGQYLYIATHAWWMATVKENSYLGENLLETWVPADQKQDWLWRRTVTGKRKWLSGSAGAARAEGIPIDEPGWPEGEWRAPCGDWFAAEEGREPCTNPANWDTPSREFLATLPRDPDKLYNRMRGVTEGRGQTPDLEMLVYAGDALRSGLVPADLRAAFYRALAKLPDLQITEQVANLDGRKGTAYGITGEGTRYDIIIDPSTGEFIGERQVLEDGDEYLPPGTVTTYTSVDTAVVSGMGARP
jgi:hypothetical protein